MELCIPKTYAMAKKHHYTLTVKWTGNLGQGTAAYDLYSRDHQVKVAGKVMIPGSADPAFRGTENRYNPEEMFLSSISTCHMLWYLHLCATKQIVVLDYEDHPEGTMVETPEGSGHFTRVMLRPRVTIAEGNDTVLAAELHEEANRYCFIANSLNFKVGHEPIIKVS